MSARGSSTAPSVAKSGVHTWQSTKWNSRADSVCTSRTTATLEASLAVENMLSPKNARPSETPYRPPTSASPRPESVALCS